MMDVTGAPTGFPGEGPWLSLHCGLSSSVSKRVLVRAKVIARETPGGEGDAGVGA